MLGERHGKPIEAPAPLRCTCILQVHRSPLRHVQSKHEVRRESLSISTYLLIHALRLYTVQIRQIRIEHDPLSTNQVDAAGDMVDWILVCHRCKSGYGTRTGPARPEDNLVANSQFG